MLWEGEKGMHWGYPPPTNSELIFDRSPKNLHFPLLVGQGYPQPCMWKKDIWAHTAFDSQLSVDINRKGKIHLRDDNIHLYR